MKNPIRILAALAIVAALAVTYACKDDDPTPLALSTITVGGADLNGGTSPTGVATDATIEVNFSTTVDATTATAANIKLTRDYDDADIPLTITPDGSKITIKPTSKLDAGNTYILSVSDALKSDKGLTLTSFTRNFTTAGFFAPAGQEAYWMFESNTNDAAGTHNATNTVDVTYVDGRNAAAGKAASFNGTTTIVEIPNGDAFMSTQSMTLAFWVKADASSGKGYFVIGLAGSKGFQYEIPADMKSVKLAAQYQLDANTFGEDLWWPGEGLTVDSWPGYIFSKDVGGGDGVNALFSDKWAHVVCTFEASTKIGTMYINGEKVKAIDFTHYPADDARKATPGLKYGGPASPGNNLAFGFIQGSPAENRALADDWAAYETPGNNHFKGLLDDIRIFKKAISADEVSRIYQSEK